ncbi:MAG: glycoside hydrolase family 26 protein [Coriobacteriia bacterium]|nr:glycoside hydrolase family 26 protein [Coriobacteriia bacterium]
MGKTDIHHTASGESGGSGGRSKGRVVLAVLLFVVFMTAMGWQVYRAISVEAGNSGFVSEVTQIFENVFREPEILYESIPLDGPTLWRNEAASQSKFPAGLHEISEIDEHTSQFTNNYFGYSFTFPSEWEADNRAVPHYTRFFSDDFRIDITVQDVTEAWTNTGDFISKTLSPIKGRITLDESRIIDSADIRIVDYSRPFVAGIENDMNHYSYIFITRGTVVYLMQLKTGEDDLSVMKDALEEVLDSFTFTAPQEFDLNSEIEQLEPDLDLTLEHENKTLHIPADTFMMGMYMDEALDINRKEEIFGTQIGLQMFYTFVDSPYNTYVNYLVDRNTLPMVTLLFEEGHSDDNVDVVKGIIAGQYDDTLTDWAENIARLDAPVLIRPGNEMNGDWSEWSLQYNYNDPDLYKLAFTHIVNVFGASGADNAYFVWNPNGNSAPYFSWNDAAMFYPSDEVVDFVGLTYYHFGSAGTSNFKKLYEGLYWEYARTFFEKPLIIGEVGAVEHGTDKAAWITEIFEYAPAHFSRIKMVVWFDARHGGNLTGTGPDLRLSTSDDSLEAFREGMNRPTVIKGIYDTSRR